MTRWRNFAVARLALPRAVGRAMTFRRQLLLVNAAVVLLTMLLMLVPAYLTTRAQVTAAYRERLSAVALGASVSLPVDVVDSLAAAGPRTTVPYVVARTALRTFWSAPADDPGATGGGVALVRAERGRYRVLAHSRWTGDPPAAAETWTPPEGLADSLANLRAGSTPVFWFADADRLVAAAPVVGDGTVPAGVAVATLDARAAVAAANRQLLRLAWWPLLALGAAMLLSAWLVRGLARRILGAVRHAETIAAGDLRPGPAASGGADEVGRLRSAMREMAVRLSGIIAEVRAGAESVASASAQLTSTSQALADGTGRQIASVLDTTAALSQVSASIGQTALHSRQMETAALRDARGAEEGGRAVEETVRMMNAIAEKVTVIQDIARKTDLLSLNAAIEAARAGEHGRGFGVVAEEVRRLAERVEAAANEIDTLTRASVRAAEVSGSAIRELVPSIRHTAGLVQEVTAAAHQQAAAVSEIDATMRGVDGVAHQNAAAAQELAATAEQMAAQAETLRVLIDVFRVDGAAARPRTPESPAEATRALRFPLQPREPEVHGGAAEALEPAMEEAVGF